LRRCFAQHGFPEWPSPHRAIAHHPTNIRSRLARRCLR
jgi:hypothetical protein